MTPVRAVRQRLNPLIVGVEPCLVCQAQPVKLPGRIQPLCLACYSAERQMVERHAAGAPRYVSACVAGPDCPGCGSGDVDADGALWWCNACGICTRVGS